MHQIILAVSHAGWLTGEKMRAILFLTFFIGMAIFFIGNMIRDICESRRRWARWEAEDAARQELARRRREHREREQAFLDEYGRICYPTSKRRKDHPLTTIFKDEMPTPPTIRENQKGVPGELAC